jgi:hypothetical protein
MLRSRLSRYFILALLNLTAWPIDSARAELIELTLYRREPFAKGASIGNMGS